MDWFEEAVQDATANDGMITDYWPDDPADLAESPDDADSDSAPGLDPAPAADIDRSQWQLPEETTRPPAPAKRRGRIIRILAWVGALFGRAG
jgi:hypothetical protein